MTAARPTARQLDLLDRLTGVILAEGFLAHTLDELAARLRCSKSSLYTLAPSKEQLVLTVVRHFFRDAAARVEERLAAAPDPLDRVAAYLAAVADELGPASAAFHADLAAFPPAGEIYARNTALAAERVQRLIADGVAADAMRRVDARFVGAAVAQVMAAIQRGEMTGATGLDDSAAYRSLAELVTAALIPERAPA